MTNTYRPQSLQEFIGQQKIKEFLQIIIDASLKNGNQIKHILLYGPPGLGKTTLCHIIASELDAKLHSATAPALEKISDLLSLLVNLQAGDILLIDEIHRLSPQLEEMLYSAMEDNFVDVIIDTINGVGKSVRIDLPPFTLIGATTKMGNVSKPLQTRFAHTFKLEYYTVEEQHNIVKQLSTIYQTPILPNVIDKIITLGRGIPRLLQNSFLQLRDIAIVLNGGVIDALVINKAYHLLGIDNRGINDIEKKYLKVLVNTYNGGPVGIETLALTLNEPATSIIDLCESYLIRLGIIKYTRHGRLATAEAFKIVKEWRTCN